MMPSDDMNAYVKALVGKRLGIRDASTEEISLLVKQPDLAAYTFADMVSRRAQAGWSTHGHSGKITLLPIFIFCLLIMLPSGADVNIYTSSKDWAAALVGNHENTEVGKFLRDYLEVDVDAITRELVQQGPKWDTVSASGVKESWLGPLPAVDIGNDHLDHYHGDFKKYKRCEICDA